MIVKVPYREDLAAAWNRRAILAREAVEVPQWVSVEERLPAARTDFLALNRDGRIFESRMCYGMHEPWFTYPRGDGNPSNTMPDWIDVTHWMPLPASPTKGQL